MGRLVSLSASALILSTSVALAHGVHAVPMDGHSHNVLAIVFAGVAIAAVALALVMKRR